MPQVLALRRIVEPTLIQHRVSMLNQHCVSTDNKRTSNDIICVFVPTCKRIISVPEEYFIPGQQRDRDFANSILYVRGFKLFYVFVPIHCM